MNINHFINWPPNTTFQVNGECFLKLSRPFRVVGPFTANAVKLSTCELVEMPLATLVQAVDDSVWRGIRLVVVPGGRAIQLAGDYILTPENRLVNAVTVGDPVALIQFTPVSQALLLT